MDIDLSKDRIYVNPVVGVVKNIRHTRNGSVGTLEVFATERDRYPSRVTVWGAVELGLSEGSRVALKGFLSARVDEYTNREGELKHTVALHLNGAKVIATEQGGQRADSGWPAEPPQQTSNW